MSVKRLSFLIVIFIAFLAAGCGSGNQQGRPAPGPVPVSVQKVGYDYVPYYEEYPTVTRAVQEVELRPQVSGYITGIHFKEGSEVKAGQKLYTIDQQQTLAAYNQAQANLAVQEANLERARKDLSRYQELDSLDAIARQQVDYAQAAYAAAQQQVEAARAAVRSVQTNVRYSTIVAPFDGTIGISLVRLGAAVSPGQTVLNVISSNDPMLADIVVDQAALPRFTELAARKVSNTDTTFQLVLNKKAYQHYGQLSLIDRAVDPQTGAIKIRVELPNPGRELRPGMSGTLRVLTNGAEKSVTIPFKAVTEQLGEFFVYVSDGSKVSQRRVRLGRQVGKKIIVTSGLSEGEVVVTEGVQNLREGSAIAASGQQ